MRRGRILYFLLFVLLHRIPFFSEQMEYFWFVEHFVITIQHQLTCQMLFKNTQLSQSLVLQEQLSFLVPMNQKNYFFFFSSALRSKDYSLPILTKIYCSKWKKLIQR